MSSEEEDYMSMDFTVTPQNDVRPGLLLTAKQKREHELLKRKQEFDAKFGMNKKKNSKVLEEEHREEGLRKPIEEDNRGFALLAKMGYKPGGGIGKTAEKQSNPTALIDITVKTSRKGLGLAERKPRMRSTNLNGNKFVVSAELSSSQLNAFRSALAAKHGERKLLADLCHSQKVCASLEKAAGWSKPVTWWYWPHSEIEEDLDNDDDEEQDDVDQEENHVEPSDRNNATKKTKNLSEKEQSDVFDKDDDCNRLSDTDETSSRTKSIDSEDHKCDRPSDSDANKSEQKLSSHKTNKEEMKSERKDNQAKNCNSVSDNINNFSKDNWNLSKKEDLIGQSNHNEAKSCDSVSDRIDNFSEVNCKDVAKETDCGDLRIESKVKSAQNEDIVDDLEEEKEHEKDNYEDHLSTAEKLEILTGYLRSNYFYCIWCGTQYTDEPDLTKNCPGDSSEDH